MLKTPIMLCYPRTKFSQSKQWLHIFLEEVKWKIEDDFGNSIVDKYTRSSEMKSKFQREQRTRIIF